MTARSTHASWRADDTTVTTRTTRTTRRRLLGVAMAATIALAACGGDDDDAGASAAATTAPSTPLTVTSGPGSTDPSTFTGTLTIGAIPDQEPERLQRTYDLVADHLEAALPGITVEYVPVTDYQAAVTAFATGDLELVWFGGLTGVQARLEVDGAQAILQRDIDAEFTSVFIAGVDTGIEPVSDVEGLAELAGHSFTFGSESSTSGRLMPQSFLAEAGIDVDESFTGTVGFSGSHDATIELVAAGTYEAGALNSQVWDSRVAEGAVDTDLVTEVFRTPPYFDYHWVARPGLDEAHGEGFTDALIDAFTSLDADDSDDAAILELFGAESFIPTSNENYAAIEAVARDIGAIR